MRSFAGITNSNYAGSIQALPTNINNTKFGQQPALPPSCVALAFDWAKDYGASTAKPNIAVSVNIGGGGTTRQKLDNVRSVRIDNLGNPVPVYVNFPDTNYTVVAPPNSIVRENVETGQFSAFIYAEGFTTGQTGLTAVYFYNYPSPPFLDTEINQTVDLWRASASISRGGTILNQNFGPPALGDQTIQFSNFVSANGVIQNNVMFTPFASGFLYVTHVDFSLTNINIPGAGGATLTLIMESTGSAGILYFLIWGSNPPNPAGSFINIQKILNLSAMNIKLDATQTWRLRISGLSNLTATMQSTFNYTTNPT